MNRMGGDNIIKGVVKVRGLDQNLNVDEIKSIFAEQGAVPNEIRFIKEWHGQQKRLFFLTFVEIRQFELALQLDGMFIHGNAISVMTSNKNEMQNALSGRPPLRSTNEKGFNKTRDRSPLRVDHAAKNNYNSMQQLPRPLMSQMEQPQRPILSGGNHAAQTDDLMRNSSVMNPSNDPSRGNTMIPSDVNRHQNAVSKFGDPRGNIPYKSMPRRPGPRGDMMPTRGNGRAGPTGRVMNMNIRPQFVGPRDSVVPKGVGPRGDINLRTRPLGYGPRGDINFNIRPRGNVPRGDMNSNVKIQGDGSRETMQFEMRPQGVRPRRQLDVNLRPQGLGPRENMHFNTRPQGIPRQNSNLGDSERNSQRGIPVENSVSDPSKNDCMIGLRDLPFSVTPDEILEFFTSNGFPAIPGSVRIHLFEDGKPSGDAVISLPSLAIAKAALEVLSKLRLASKRLEIFICD